MATFLDSALGTGTGRSCQVADGLDVVAGCLVWLGAKLEGDGTQVVTADNGEGASMSAANAKRNVTGDFLSGATFWWTSTITGKIRPRFSVLPSATFLIAQAMSFLPADGKILTLGNVNAADDGSGSSATPNSGSASATAAGVTIGFFPLFGSRQFTGLDGSFLEPAEFNISQAAHSTYFLQSGSGAQTASGTLGSAVEWVAQVVNFNEADTPVPKIPFIGYRTRRSRYPF